MELGADIFAILSWKHVTDNMLQMHVLISPHSMYILPRCTNYGDIRIHVSFDLNQKEC